MGRGIQGHITISKNTKDKDIYFRSLLELCYIIKMQESDDVSTITSEPFFIDLVDGSTYLPDFLINDKILVELKPYNHLKWRTDSKNDRFKKEMDGAVKYCNEHGYEFKLIYDTDLDFKTDKYKRYLLSHPEIIEKYNIRFNKELKMY